MVNNAEIIRWARGVFSRKEFNRLPSIEEVAIIKAQSFGREITVADTLDSIESKSENSPGYLINGRSSSFVFQGKVRIHLQARVVKARTHKQNEPDVLALLDADNHL